MQLVFFNKETEDEAEESAVDYGLIQRRALAMEHLVAADILQRNWDCSFAAAGLRYDLVADVAGLRRIQVKMAQHPRLEGGNRLYYKFGCGIAASLSKGSDGRLNSYVNSIDLFAFVACDIRRIIYVLPRKIETQKMLLPASEFSPEKSEMSWSEILREWGIT